MEVLRLNHLSAKQMILLYSIMFGFLSHAVYKRHEPTLKQFFSTTSILLAAFLVYCSQTESRVTWPLFFGAITLYFLSMGASILVYRLLLHPLRKYPGPFWSKLTRFEAAIINYRQQTHWWIENCHRQWGDVVRVGPNELSFAHADHVPYIHGNKSEGITRGPWYDGNPGEDHGHKSLATTRDLKEHGYKRRIWEPAFTIKALKSYQPRILPLILRVCEHFDTKSGTEVDFGDWADYYTLDVMGEMGFGETFEAVESGKTHSFMTFIHQSLHMLVFFSAVPWLTPLWSWLPIDEQKRKDTASFWAFAKDRFEKRKAKGTDRADVFSYLLDRDEESGKSLHPREIEAESRVVIIAGANSTGLSIAFCGYQLFRHPESYKRLQAEVDSIWNGTDMLDGVAMLGVDKAPFMNACINESLRLMPPGPNGMQRRTPAEGKIVNGVFIPPETQVSVHAWTMQRDERFFSRPLEFLPQRWLDEERPADWVHDTRASPSHKVVPFSVGQLGCVGKQLALLEMRYWWAYLSKRFNFQMASHFNEAQFQAECKSNLTLLKGKLPVVLTVRKH